MRVGLGIAFRKRIQTDVLSTTFAALSGAVVDALLGASGLMQFRSAAALHGELDLLKQTELRLHYEGFKIINIDCVILAARDLGESMIDEIRDKMCKALFIDSRDMNIKIYNDDQMPYAVQVQAVALIGQKNN